MDARASESETLEKVIRAHAPSLVRAAFAVLKSLPDAEDVAQEAFVAWLRKRPAFESAEHERAWLLRVAVNMSRSRRRSAWFSRERNPLPEELAGIPEEQSEVLEAVLSLPEKYRVPIHLFYYEGYSIREIAAITGKKPATLGTNLARARELLKQKLGGFD